MLTRWGDVERSFGMLDEMRRRMDQMFNEFDAQGAGYAGSGGPRVTLWDEGSSLMLAADLPGVSEKDVKLSVNQDVLTLEGERRVEGPKGYAAHRQERSGFRFARSFTLPCKVDPERAQATVRDGVLTVTLPKAPESQPRQIAVKAGT